MKQVNKQQFIQLQPRQNLGLGNVVSLRSFDAHSIMANEYNTPSGVSET